ncbi:MAG: tRNA (adenosine(37)-N6)-threonylcarbamoyltransferase complex ATPase subunit type 1 TsaE [Flavobacteriaceae bacterium]|nr:tRNA (adenosine(37)-N6)-threonylcarbamoyltransferase complex ATPase subunit type 1 TsaE [Flavobacteriaceae bacterium]
MNREFYEDDIEDVASELLSVATHNIIRIEAPMGAGKTTLIKSLCSVLGVKETISSPTFSIVNHYQTNSDTIYHFDFYRIEDPNEAADIGIEEYFESNAFCFLEWAEKIETHLPKSIDHFYIDVLDSKRRRIRKK